MKTYVGTKVLQAEPMTRGDYNVSRGWKLPANEEASEPGYRVVYQDGYVSWSPAPQFEESYLDLGDVSRLQPYQLRVVAEKAQLDDRLEKLTAFIARPSFHDLTGHQQSLMVRQRRVMEEYQEVLEDRIATFGGERI